MIKIAIVLVHNKGNKGNSDQIDIVNSLLIYHQQESNSFYTLNGYIEDHEIRIFQVIPFEVTPPENLDLLDSYKVFYGLGDEDKTGDHPRFFNWGTKRSTDYGSDIVIHIDDATQFNRDNLIKKLPQIIDKNDTTVFSEDTYGKIISVEALKRIGQLNESVTKQEAIEMYKTRITRGGLKNG